LSSLYIYILSLSGLSFFLSLLYVEERCCLNMLSFVVISCFALIFRCSLLLIFFFLTFHFLHHMCPIASLLLCLFLFSFF
jgi:hypothetical protein